VWTFYWCPLAQHRQQDHYNTEANGNEFGETDKEVTKTGHYLCRKAGKKSDAGQIIGEHQLV